MHYKITPSLYSSWLFYRQPLFDRDDEQEAQARAEFISVLNKEQKPDTPEQARGHLFENWIESIALGKKYELDELAADELACAKAIATNCHDGVFQEKDGRELPTGDYVYGIADCILPTQIVDFKRVSAYDMGKYQQSIQHLVYMYIWGINRFDYLVCDGSAEPFVETYNWTDKSLGLLQSRIATMIHNIEQDPELRSIFEEKWEYKK